MRVWCQLMSRDTQHLQNSTHGNISGRKWEFRGLLFLLQGFPGSFIESAVAIGVLNSTFNARASGLLCLRVAALVLPPSGCCTAPGTWVWYTGTGSTGLQCLSVGGHIVLRSGRGWCFPPRGSRGPPCTAFQGGCSLVHPVRQFGWETNFHFIRINCHADFACIAIAFVFVFQLFPP